MRCTVEGVPQGEVPWADLDRRGERSVFTTRPWLDFLGTAQGVEPAVARVRCDGRDVGWFTGATVRRLGMQILGSPLPGWSTSYMGFDWDDPADARLTPLALAAVRRWAFGRSRCMHLEVMDRSVRPGVELPRGFAAEVFHSYELTLSSDDEMLAGMSTNARRNVRRADRRGVRVAAVDAADRGDAHAFVEEYYPQAVAAFARRGALPSYGVERLHLLVDALLPSGRLLLLRALAPDGGTAATSISVGQDSGRAVFLMGAGDPSSSDLRPNDAVMWAALRSWRDRDARSFDFGGGGTYKEKFGCTPIETAWVRASRTPGVDLAREAVRRRAQRRFAQG